MTGKDVQVTPEGQNFHDGIPSIQVIPRAFNGLGAKANTKGGAR